MDALQPLLSQSSEAAKWSRQETLEAFSGTLPQYHFPLELIENPSSRRI